MSEVDLIVDMIEGDLIVEVAAMMIAGVDLDTTEIDYDRGSSGYDRDRRDDRGSS